MLHTWLIYHDCVICLSKYQCVLISWTNLDLIKVYVCVLWFCTWFFVVYVFFFFCVQMSCHSSRGKKPVIDVPSSPISKWTQRLSQDSNSERFRTPLDSQTFSSIFVKAPIVVERVVKFDTLGTTFIPRIFEAKDWLIYLGASRTQLMNWWRSSI